VEAEPGEFFIVPGRWHKLHHCTDAIAPERHPRAGYRVMRFVQPI